MALKGRAFMAVWHDIAQAGEAEYSSWHTRQHMPERLGVPGFLVGRRGVNWSLKHQRWFTLYETQNAGSPQLLRLPGTVEQPDQLEQSQPAELPELRPFGLHHVRERSDADSAARTPPFRLNTRRRADHRLLSRRSRRKIWRTRSQAMDGVVGAHLRPAAPDTTRIKTREFGAARQDWRGRLRRRRDRGRCRAARTGSRDA